MRIERETRRFGVKGTVIGGKGILGLAMKQNFRKKRHHTQRTAHGVGQVVTQEIGRGGGSERERERLTIRSFARSTA